MTLMTVESSAFHAVDFHKEDKTLDVYFKDGKTTQFVGVPQEVFNEFIQSESLGRYFNMNIRPKYKNRNIRP